MMKKNENKINYINFNRKKYSLDLDVIRKICLTSSSDGGSKEIEITQVYEYNDDGIPLPASKVDHETKVSGNPQNDMIVYDIVKLFVVRLLENELLEKEFEWDFSTALAVNTLLNWGVLKEVE